MNSVWIVAAMLLAAPAENPPAAQAVLAELGLPGDAVAVKKLDQAYRADKVTLEQVLKAPLLYPLRAEV